MSSPVYVFDPSIIYADDQFRAVGEENDKGGVGKTLKISLMAVHAATVAKHTLIGKKWKPDTVVVVDLDPQPGSTQTFDAMDRQYRAVTSGKKYYRVASRLLAPAMADPNNRSIIKCLQDPTTPLSQIAWDLPIADYIRAFEQYPRVVNEHVNDVAMAATWWSQAQIKHQLDLGNVARLLVVPCVSDLRPIIDSIQSTRANQRAYNPLFMLAEYFLHQLQIGEITPNTLLLFDCPGEENIVTNMVAFICQLLMIPFTRGIAFDGAVLTIQHALKLRSERRDPRGNPRLLPVFNKAKGTRDEKEDLNEDINPALEQLGVDPVRYQLPQESNIDGAESKHILPWIYNPNMASIDTIARIYAEQIGV